MLVGREKDKTETGEQRHNAASRQKDGRETERRRSDDETAVDKKDRCFGLVYPHSTYPNLRLVTPIPSTQFRLWYLFVSGALSVSLFVVSVSTHKTFAVPTTTSILRHPIILPQSCFFCCCHTCSTRPTHFVQTNLETDSKFSCRDNRMAQMR